MTPCRTIEVLVYASVGEEAVYNKLCVKVDNEESSLRNILKLSSDNIKILRRFKEYFG